MTHSVLLIVRVLYLPPRAATFTPGPKMTKTAVRALRQDLKSLGFPEPPESSLTIPAGGIVKFFWKREQGGQFHEVLKRKIASISQEQLYKQRISKITLKPVSDKKLHRPPPPMQFPVMGRVPTSIPPQDLINIPHSTPIPESALDESRLSGPSVSNLTQVVQMGTSYPQYTGSDCPAIMSEIAVPCLDQLDIHSGPQSPVLYSTPVEGESSIVIGKRTSRSVSPPPPPPAKRSRTGSAFSDDESSLLHELGLLNEEMKFLAARQKRIREKLQHMGAPTIPEPDFLFRDEFELEIDTERKQRIECEMVLMDIRRECRAPFIVPALFDAFIDISKLTTAALDSLT
ncbi:uncharacterized protein BT62DRAFT_1080622 [Guyanagaster necrorhizus]|uniref:Uncharacterized protein n=1 Tax=Guyanagaster necrorhizus TaxID=856835 RepID=A0A9P7VHM3_9AGAR|nr:uncharacterized protein BT62DRAFT_1080622 [Guyanagaster necrorhizus MCA 3950]KAG7440762.1 hypothetical protein BT62DRAFT_1080622 [Guyanagaster necrorhizus MCA 3950]